MKIGRRRSAGVIALIVSAVCLVAAGALANVVLALVGSVALVAALLAVERYPRPRDW
jgi:hypothetical protein